MEEKRTRRSFTREFKIEAVQLVKQRDGKVTEVANNLGIHPVLMHRWIRAYSDDPQYAFPLSPDLVNQNFSATAHNKLWTSDITYIRTKEGWLYLTVILDVFNRQIVGWSMSDRLTTIRTTIPALIHACKHQKPAPGLIFHSDRGVQYASHEFRYYLKKYKIVQSMSCKGNCYDNTIIESFISTLKTELIYFEKYQTRKQAQFSIFEYIEIFYNKQRKHSSLSNKTPYEYLKLNEAA